MSHGFNLELVPFEMELSKMTPQIIKSSSTKLNDGVPRVGYNFHVSVKNQAERLMMKLARGEYSVKRPQWP